MNWALFGSCAVCLPVLFLMKTNYNRLGIDTNLVDMMKDINFNEKADVQSEPTKLNSNQSEDITNNNNWFDFKDEKTMCFPFLHAKKNYKMNKIPNIIDTSSLWSVQENNNKVTIRIQTIE